MNIEWVKTTDIHANENNPRILKDDKFKKLVQSIKDFPEMLEIRPIVVNNDMMVLGGNMRLKAIQEIGLKEIPIIKAENLTEEQQREFLIKDNVGFGEWDWDALANDWDADDLKDWGMDLPTDFNPEVLEAEEDDFEIPETIETDIVLGDLFEIGEHRLLCGDSTDSDAVAKLMNGEKADMVFTDPPYNIDYEGKTKQRLKIQNDKKTSSEFYGFLFMAFKNYFDFTHKGTAIYIAHADSERINFQNAMEDVGYRQKQTIIWVKDSIVLGRQDYHWRHEPILYGWKDDNGKHKWESDRKQDTVWEVKRPTVSKEHPTMKPIELCSKGISNSSKIGEGVLDLFLGSGSTMVASHQLKRKCYGMELDPKYCQVIVDRMKKLDATIKIKKNGVEI